MTEHPPETPKPPPTATQQILGLAEVPRSKWRKMLAKTASGGVIVALAAFGGGQWDWPWYAVLGTGVFGATVWAGQIVLSPLRILIGHLKELGTAWNAPPPPPGEGGQP